MISSIANIRRIWPRRPPPDLPYNEEELAALQKQFTTISESSLESFYHQAYRRCQYVYHPPTSKSIQELVAIWKFIRRWKRTRH